MEIQETVERYAEIISKIAFVDVEVVDRRLFRVAGTGMFKAHVNEDMSSAGYTYSRVLETGERQIICEPGKDPVCDQCPQKGVCGEEIEIAMPVRLGEEIIGVIGLVGNSKSRKRMILRNEKLYLDLIEQISDFIAGKAAEVSPQAMGATWDKEVWLDYAGNVASTTFTLDDPASTVVTVVSRGGSLEAM